MLLFSSLMYKFIFKKGSKNIFTLLLVGVVCGTLFESLTTFMQVLIDPVEFQMVQDKMQASFNNINTDLLFISSIVIIICIGYVYDYLKILDVMSLGRDEAIKRSQLEMAKEIIINYKVPLVLENEIKLLNGEG